MAKYPVLKMLTILPCVAVLGGMMSSAWAQHVEPDPGGEDTASSAQQASALQMAHAIANRFSPVANAFAYPGAPSSEAEISPVAFTASDSLKGLSIWSSFANSWQRNRQAIVKSRGTNQTITFGIDYAISSMLTIGLSGNYSHSDTDTIFNGGYTRSNNGSVVPYVNLTLTEWLSADISAGYSFGHTKQNRIVFGAPSRSSYDTHGWLLSANLNAARWYGSWMFSAKGGLFINSNHQASFIESNGTVHTSSDSKLTQVSLGGTVSYYMAPVMPYASLTYKYDLVRDKPVTPGVSDDRDEFELGAGFHVYGTGEWKNLTGGLSVTTVLGRSHKRNTTLAVNLRYSF